MINYLENENKKFNVSINIDNFKDLFITSLSENLDKLPELINHFDRHVLSNELNSDGTISYEIFNKSIAKLPPYGEYISKNNPELKLNQMNLYKEEAKLIAEDDSYSDPVKDYKNKTFIFNTDFIGFKGYYDDGYDSLSLKFIKVRLKTNKVIPKENTESGQENSVDLSDFVEFVVYSIDPNNGNIKISTYFFMTKKEFLYRLNNRKNFYNGSIQSKDKSELDQTRENYPCIIYTIDYSGNEPIYETKQCPSYKLALRDYYNQYQQNTKKFIYKIESKYPELNIPDNLQTDKALIKYNNKIDEIDLKYNIDITNKYSKIIKLLLNRDLSNKFITSVIKILGVNFLKNSPPEDIIKKINTIISLNGSPFKKINDSDINTYKELVFNESLELIESDKKIVRLLTRQGKKVREVLARGEVYKANFGTFAPEQYKELSNYLHLDGCPIFCIPEEYENKYEEDGVSGYKGITDEQIKSNPLILKVPEDKIHTMEYYNWSDYLYYTEYEDDDTFGYTCEESLKHIDKYLGEIDKPFSAYEYPQVVIDEIRPEWVVNNLEEDYTILNERRRKRKTVKPEDKQLRFNTEEEDWPIVDYPQDDDDDYYGPYTPSKDDKVLELDYNNNVISSGDTKEKETTAKDDLDNYKSKWKYSYTPSYISEEEAFKKYNNSNTLVIHKTDSTTTMLKQLYDGKGWDVINDTEEIDHKVLHKLINSHERIAMLGHGAPSGLFGSIRDCCADELKGKKLFMLWCNADAYAQKHPKLGTGFFCCGNMPSDNHEAAWVGYDVTFDWMDENITYWCKLCGDVIEQCLEGNALEGCKYVRDNYWARYKDSEDPNQIGITVYNYQRTKVAGEYLIDPPIDMTEIEAKVKELKAKKDAEKPKTTYSYDYGNDYGYGNTYAYNGYDDEDYYSYFDKKKKNKNKGKNTLYTVRVNYGENDFTEESFTEEDDAIDFLIELFTDWKIDDEKIANEIINPILEDALAGNWETDTAGNKYLENKLK